MLWRYSLAIFFLGVIFHSSSFGDDSKPVPNLSCISTNGYGFVYSADKETATLSFQGNTLLENLRCVTLANDGALVCGNGPMVEPHSASARSGIERYCVLIEYDRNRQTDHGSTVVKNMKRLANLTCEEK